MTAAPRNALASTIRKEGDWLIDDAGNKNSISYWGSEEVARMALESLKDCDNCINCSRCSDCLGCSDCLRCSGCSRCLCCSDCSRCSDCSGCSGCSDCSRCSDCSGCSNVAQLYGKQNLKGDPETNPGQLGRPEIPVIENIHQRVYEAASKPKALDMSTWHYCDSTHCRGGWVVTLAGEKGKALEAFYHNDTGLAAQLIYDASDTSQKFNPCRFFDRAEDAMADMKRLAEEEAAKATPAA